MFIKLERYNPQKPYYKMSIEELVKHSKKCVRLDNFYFNKRRVGCKRRRTKNKRNRETRKRRKRTRRISLQIKKMEVEK